MAFNVQRALDDGYTQQQIDAYLASQNLESTKEVDTEETIFNPNPTEEDMLMLKGLQGKLKNSIFYYSENIQDWEKHTTTIDLPQPVLEHQEYLDTGTSAEEDE